MKESDIRTDDELEYRWSLYRKDQSDLLNKKNGFVDVPCPACEANDCASYYKRDGFSFKICIHCDTVYVSPRPTFKMLLEHYRNSRAEKYFNENVYPRTEKSRVEYLIKPRLDRIIEFCKKYDISMGRLVDVGAGYGTFCEYVQNASLFKNVIAIEPDPSPAQICKSKGVHVISKFVEHINLKSKADIVTSFECIEHVFDPKVYISSISKIMKKGGLFVITTPNIKGFDLLTLKCKSDNTTAPDHLNYFHPESLSLVLRRCGFKILEVQTPGKLDVELVRKKVLDGKISLSDQPFLKRIIVDEYQKFGDSFQKWLAANELSSHLWVISKKIK
jgi:2-polyprenyl-3-methyl-5-hydroxy-6-metoxy-1,4-benzoquinol methylase